jgi:thiamine-monophosphate kinase
MPRRNTQPLISEDQLIEHIARRLAPGTRAVSPALVLGIGDDAAILRPPVGEDWVFSTDFSLEDVHFLADAHPPEAIGFRALARAASDLGAMGAHPAFFLLSLSLPRERTGRWLDRMLAGMARAARRLQLRLIGGDTTRWPKVALSLTVIGRTARGAAVRRDGARPGDQLFLSGRLGAAALGLELLLRRHRGRGRTTRLTKAAERRLLQPHLYPSIPLALGIHLAENRIASAMIDLSDGLSSDLTRMALASRSRARIFLDRLPVVRVPAAISRGGLEPLQLALHGGEDYGLLFAVPPARVSAVPRSFRGAPITRIGEFVRGRGVVLVGPQGLERPLAAAGWDPFRERR